MRITLLFPPQWTAAQPYFGLITLNGQLRRAGFEVKIRDLNLELMEYVTRPANLRYSHLRLQSEQRFLTAETMLRLATEDRSDQLGHASKKLLTIERYLESEQARIPEIIESSQEALERLRQPKYYYDPAGLIRASTALDQALRLFSLPYYPTDVRWNDFYQPIYGFDMTSFLGFLEDKYRNPFLKFYETWLPKLLDEDQPDLIALSMNSFSQVLPGLTLASMLKQAIQKRRLEGALHVPHLGLGGNFFSRLRDSLVRRPDFFAHFADSVLIGEGERPIVQLAQALDPAKKHGTLSLQDVPALLYLDSTTNEVVESSAKPSQGMMDDLAYADLAGFPIDRYLAPDRVVCIRASKGCYWEKCTFCDSYYGLSNDVMQIERLLAEMRYLRDEYGVHHFEFIDQCISPTYLHKMCDALLREDLGVRWFCNARTESGFTRELLDKMHKAGATMIMWGVESGSPRLLKLMKKGVSPKGRLEILRNSTEAGIWNFAYVFFGFPTETQEEAMMTIDLVRHHTDIVHSYGRSVFTLGKHSPLMQDPSHFGVFNLIEEKQEFSTNLTFETLGGLQGLQVTEIADMCNRLCREAYGDPLWMTLRSRESLHLYLARYGQRFVRTYDLSGALATHHTQEDFVF